MSPSAAVEKYPLPRSRADASLSDAAETDRAAITETHMESLKTFEAELITATKTALQEKRQYDKVYALVTHWSDEVSDRKYLKDEARNLWELFRDSFGFEVGDAPFELPAEDPRSAFDDVYQSTLKKAKPNGNQTNLFILYYGGHAAVTDGWNGEATWESNIKGTHKIYWNSFQDRLEEVRCDLLFLFDCCYGGAMLNPKWAYKKRCEMLCSSPPKSQANGTKDHSFTAALVSVLKEEFGKHGNCNIITLSSILSDTKRAETLKTDPFFWMHSKPTQPSIVLHSIREADRDTSAKSQTRLTISRLQQMSDARVLFKITFLDHEMLPIISEWEQFLRFRPSNIAEIEVYLRSELAMHCCFKTRSSSAVMSIPLWLWNSLKPHQARELIAIIRSADLLESGRRAINPEPDPIAINPQPRLHPKQAIPVSEPRKPTKPPKKTLPESALQVSFPEPQFYAHAAKLHPMKSSPTRHTASKSTPSRMTSTRSFDYKPDYRNIREQVMNDDTGLYKTNFILTGLLKRQTVH